jgi:hypothetical protein
MVGPSHETDKDDAAGPASVFSPRIGRKIRSITEIYFELSPQQSYLSEHLVRYNTRKHRTTFQAGIIVSFPDIGVGSLAAATISGVHLVLTHMHWKKPHQPLTTLSPLSCTQILAQSWSSNHGQHTPL